MIGAIPILLAATLTTLQNKDFFTLSSWIPSTVSSHDTPGSDPSGGSGGWYVEIYTNGVDWGDWEITRGTNVVSDYGQPTFYKNPYSAGGIWSLQSPPNSEYESGTLMFSVGSLVSMIPTYIDGTEDDDELSWVATFKGYLTYEDCTNGVETTLPVIYVATREKEETPLPSGKYQPRAARLTPEVCAGVNSTFEAIYERLYYASQGQSNVWDVATYGPTDNHKTFRFDLPVNKSIFNYNPTNRVVGTKRLVDYTNIGGLKQFLQDFYYAGSHQAIQRPGWVNGTVSDDYSTRGYMYWSSKAGQFSGNIVPSFDWTQNPASSFLSQWFYCCPTFSGLDTDSVWSMMYGVERESPCIRMLNSIKFYQDGYITEHCHWNNPNNLTMRDVIETKYPHADGWAITNTSRRLFSDRLNCMNQFIGLMDRTYHVPVVHYSSVGTNIHYYNEMKYRGDAFTSNVVYDEHIGDGGGWKVILTDPTFESGVRTNEITRTSKRATSSSINERITATVSHCGGSVFTDGLTPVSGSDEMVRQMLRNHGSSGHFTLQLYGTARTSRDNEPNGIVVGRFGEMEEEELVYSLGYPQHHNVFFLINRYYDYAHDKEVGLYTTQPGTEAIASERVIENNYGAVYGYHYQRSYYPLQDSVVYTPQGSQIRYKSKTGTYDTRYELLDDVSIIEHTLRNMFTSTYGITPTDWQQIIPIPSFEASRILSTVSVTNYVIAPTPTHWMTVVRGFHYDEEFEVDNVYSENLETGEQVEGYTILIRPIFNCTITNSPPQFVERDALALDGKIGIITRTDWEWNTLRRTDD